MQTMILTSEARDMPAYIRLCVHKWYCACQVSCNFLVNLQAMSYKYAKCLRTNPAGNQTSGELVIV